MIIFTILGVLTFTLIGILAFIGLFTSATQFVEDEKESSNDDSH